MGVSFLMSGRQCSRPQGVCSWFGTGGCWAWTPLMIAPPLTPTPPKMGQLGARFDHHAVVALSVLMDFGTVQTADLAVRKTVEAEIRQKLKIM